MRINNYRKNGSLFNVSVTSFPIYDSLAVDGVCSDVPVLTHFATILSDIRYCINVMSNNIFLCTKVIFIYSTAFN